MSDDANNLIQEFEWLWQKQANFRNLWNVAAQYVLPAWDNFIGEWAEGVNRNTRIFDSTGPVALHRFQAAMEAVLTPRSQVWHRLRADDEELDDVPAVQRWLDEVNKVLFAARYHPRSNFASQTNECYDSLGAFGNALLFVDEIMGVCLRYRSVALSEACWALNHQGQVDTVHRKFKYTAKQAVQHWGEKALPQQVRNLFQKSMFEEVDFLHVVKPNMDFRQGGFGDLGKRFESWYVHLATKSVIERRCFRTFPYAIARYRVSPRESYGRGPVTDCLPDIRTANEMVKTALRQGQKAVDPPILLAEDSVLSPFSIRSGAMNYGMVSADGRPLAVPFEAKGNWEISKELLEGTRGVIRDTLLSTLFQILVQNPNMTATEALLRAQEKGELIAPTMGRQQSEFLGPCIHRELDLLHHAGQLPPAPREILQSGRGIRVEYTSPLARALRAEEGTAIMNTIADIGTISQLDPSVRQLMDFHEAAREMGEIRGCPAKLFRSEEEVQALLEHANEQAQQAQAAQAAPGVATAIQKLAQASQQAGAAGGAGGSPGAIAVPGAA